MERLIDPESSTRRRRFEIPGVRYIFAIIGFLGFCTIYAIRVNINVAIVAMVNGSAVYDNDNETSSDECLASPSLGTNSSDSDITENGEFVWSPKMQGVILGAFYYGYCISQIPGGRLAEIFSGKWVFGIGTLITALLTLLTPLAARWHVGLLIAIRALEGLAQGVTMPAIHSMLGRWIPDSEKAVLNALVYTGINIGTVTAMPLSGYLCSSTLFGGWPSAFYVIGVLGCLWFILWWLLVTDTPLTHPFISNAELKYIISNQKIELDEKLPPIPWLRIFTSVPFIALVITQIGQDWCFYTMVNDLPTFLATVLHFKVQKTGIFSSLPYLLQTFIGLAAAFGADAVIRKGIASTSFVRKFCNSVSSFGTALALVGVCVAGCNVTLDMTFFMFSVAIGGFCFSGYMLSHLDMSPEYAGTLMGICNTLSNLTGFIVPLLVGALTEHQQTLHQWRIVFVITVAIMCFSGFVFIFFSTTEKQDWARVQETEKKSLTIVKDDKRKLYEYGSIQS